MASGNTLACFFPADNEPPATLYATLNTRNGHPVLEFDAATDWAAVFTGVLPRHYAGGGIAVYVHYAMATATTSDVIWETAFERIGDGVQDIDSDGFAAANSSGAITVPATSGNVDIVTIAHTAGGQLDSLAVGEAFRLKINRNADTDGAAGLAQLIAVELVET